jgi:hypothetical protein
MESLKALGAAFEIDLKEPEMNTTMNLASTEPASQSQSVSADEALVAGTCSQS